VRSDLVPAREQGPSLSWNSPLGQGMLLLRSRYGGAVMARANRRRCCGALDPSRNAQPGTVKAGRA